MYKIEIPNNSSSNCFDSVLYSLLKYFGFEYEAYNIKYFYTDYYYPPSNENNLIYCVRSGGQYWDALKEFYNIDVEISEEGFEVCDLLEIKPIGVHIDSYHCPWTPLYNKLTYQHIILIVGVDYLNRKYICVDSFFNKIGYIEVDFNLIKQHAKSYFTLNFEKAKEVKIESMLDRIDIALDSYNSNIVDKKLELINYLTMNDKNVFFTDNLQASPLIFNLSWIAEDKKHFAIALKYIENKKGKKFFSSIYELLSSSEQNFLLLKSVLIKYAMTGIMKEEKLKSIINQIFDIDALIVDLMKKILKKINDK